MNNHTLTFLLAFLLLVLPDPSAIWAQCNPDLSPPAMTCANKVVYLGLSGTATLFFSDSDFLDDCDGFNLNISYQLNNDPIVTAPSISVDCSHIGDNVVKTWVSDQSGNIDSCTTTIRVQDNLAPVVICKANFPVELSANGTVTITPDMINDLAFDNCGIADLKISLPNGSFEDSLVLDCNSGALVTVVLGVFTYNSPIPTTCNTNIIINDPLSACPFCNPDVTPPALNCTNTIIIYLDNNGLAYTPLSSFDINDQCDGQNINVQYQINTEPIVTAATRIKLDCSHVGNNTVKIWVSDQSGNIDSCTTTIKVQDKQAPIAICNTNFTAELSANGTVTITPDMIDEGSYDNCGLAGLKIGLLNGSLEDSLILDCNLGATVDVMLGVFEYNNPVPTLCYTSITISDPLLVCQSCNPDVAAPFFDCSDINVSLDNNGLGSIPLSFFNINDLCDGQNVDVQYQISNLFYNGPIVTATNQIDLDCSLSGNYSIKLWVTDQSGNVDSCTFNALIEIPSSFFDVNDTIEIDLPLSGSTAITPEMLLINPQLLNCSILSMTYVIQTINGGPFINPINTLTCGNVGKNIITVTILDWGSGDLITQNIILYLNDPLGICQSIDITGKVFADTSLNCILDNNEIGLPGNTDVQITNLQSGFSQMVATDNDGNYSYSTAYNTTGTTPSFEISLPNLPTDLLHCGITQTVNIPIGSSSAMLDFPVKIFPNCPYQTVDIGTNRIRPCWNSQYYVSYCNYSLLPISNAYVTVTFDTLLEVLNSDLPWTMVSNDTYTFELGTLDPIACGIFHIDVKASCDIVLGQTICAEANIYPAVNCSPFSPLWSGAQIVAESVCEGDSLSFTLENIGTGDMAQAQDYLIVEDLVMYMNNPYQLAVGEFLEVKVPANGSTWRMEAAQEPGYPGESQPIAWSEGCGGINNTGLINLFPVNNNDPFRAVFCIEAVASYDPNDKQGFPLGYDTEHYIKPNQSLEYLIRFQNTGTDTAYNVTIVDTLDHQLYFPSFRPGSSSHPYRLEMSENGVAHFIFENILLPDSLHNESASHGFVKFRIAQKPDLVPGSIIENNAAIYFDNNTPISTNTTWHTIEYPPLSTSTTQKPSLARAIKTIPNPFQHRVLFQIDGAAVKQGTLIVYDLMGKNLYQQSFSGNQLELFRNELSSGMYLYEVKDGPHIIGIGKLIID